MDSTAFVREQDKQHDDEDSSLEVHDYLQNDDPQSIPTVISAENDSNARPLRNCRDSNQIQSNKSETNTILRESRLVRAHSMKKKSVKFGIATHKPVSTNIDSYFSRNDSNIGIYDNHHEQSKSARILGCLDISVMNKLVLSLMVCTPFVTMIGLIGSGHTENWH